MKKGLRFYFALSCGKCAAFMLRALGKNATHYPGVFALKLCPRFLELIEKPETIIGVIGTNGKTTVANLITDILTDAGYDVLSNRLGGNIQGGVTTALMSGVGLSGHCRYKTAVLEMDERSSRLVLPFVKPGIIVCTNLFRDSFKRNAHSEFIFDILDSSIPKESRLVLNGDDLISSLLAKDNERKYFGVTPQPGEEQRRDNAVCDRVTCPICDTRLTYDFVRYNHIGRARCENCGFKSPTLDYAADNIDRESGFMTLSSPAGEMKLRQLGENIVDVYNAAAAAATLSVFGMGNEEIQQAFDRVKIIKTRFDDQTIAGKRVIMNLAKGQNPIACSRVFDFIRKTKGKKAVLLQLDDLFDAAHSSENIAWIYDADFEFLNDENIVQIIAGGVRCDDYRVRLLLAGVDNEKIKTAKKAPDTADLIDLNAVDTVFILYDVYTIHIANETKARLLKRLEGGKNNEN